jgi:2,3-bisphosphoglycerate-dependent phosphoglycerate mutase
VNEETWRQNAAGVLRNFPPADGATQVVLIRHGQAVCNVTGVVGGMAGCTGLTDLGRCQVEALAVRLAATGELRQAAALYSSALPRAIETAELLRAAVGPQGGALEVQPWDELNELAPGVSDGLTWQEVIDTYGLPDWDVDPTQPIAPGGESWATFVPRASAAVRALGERHRGQLVAAAVHSGVVEASMVAFLGIPTSVQRKGWLRILHASMTTWELVPDEGRWILLCCNDAYGVPRS